MAINTNKAMKLAFILSATDKMSRIVHDAIKKSSDSLLSFERTATKAGMSIMGKGAAMVAVGTAAGASVLNLAKSTATYGDDAWKTAQKVGVNVEAWQKLAYAAKYSGIEQEKLSAAMVRLNKKIIDAGRGSKEAAQTFADLGINLKDAEGNLRAPNEILEEIAQVFAQVKDGATKTALAVEFFGKAGADLIPLLNTGKDGLLQMGVEAERTGNVLEEEAAKACEIFNDDLERITTSANGLKNQFSAALIPVLDNLAICFEAIIAKITGWIQANPALAQTITKVTIGVTGLLVCVGSLAAMLGGIIFTVGKLVAVFRGLVTAFKVVQMAVLAAQYGFTAAKNGMLLFRIQYTALVVWSKIAAAAQWLFNASLYGCPVVWIIAAIVAVIAAVVLLVKNWDKVTAFFKRLWDNVKRIFSSVWEWIKNMFLNYTPAGLIIKHWDKIKDRFANLWNSVKNIFATAWEGIKNFFITMNPIRWFNVVWNKAGEWFTSLKERFFTWGGQIIQGLIDGIVAFAGKIWETIQNIGKKVGDTFCSILGIRSPSRLFVEYGMNITQGLTDGMEQGGGVVDSMTKRLALQTTGDIQPLQSHIGGVSLNYAPTIHITGSVTSETQADFARMLRQHRDEIIHIMQRHNANKLRLSYT